MFFSINSPLLSLTASMRRLLLLAMITIGISIQLSVPEGTTVTGIDVHGRTETGQTIGLPHSTTVTGGVTAPHSATTVPQSATAISPPRSATATSAPRSNTATAPRSQTSAL